MTYVEKVINNAKANPSLLILADDNIPKGMTFQTFLDYTGKLYAYLQDKGIGKEDFVLICLPRGVQPIIAEFGVLRNGSAFVIVEDNYAPERIEFIKNDCSCKLTIDTEVMRELQEYEPKEGFERADPHDAAFAIYTSGTTGSPKGVLHEYGNLERMLDSITMRSCPPLAVTGDRFALVAPLNFIASQLIIMFGLGFSVYNYVVSYAVIKNPLKIGMFLIMNRINGTFLTPSHIRKMDVKLPGLKFCIVGSEPANDIFLEGLDIHNCYLMSESGFLVNHFLLDKKYEKTPVGKPEFDLEVLLIGEDGKPVADGEEGEICFDNSFVRGYINLPDKTAEAFVDGIYHTGDLGYRDEQGRMIISGRLNDMVKINGNRVEPGEIEGVAKKVLGVDWAACRIFDDGRSTFICVYYTDKHVKIDEEEIRNRMSTYLPYYMIPSYYIYVDKPPLKATGKLDRAALPKPDRNDYLSDYEPPHDDTEKALCEAFQTILGIEKIGIKDDFYQLGGDSLSAMDVISKCGINGLNASDIFAGRTPEKIASIWKDTHPDGDTRSDEELDDEARKTPHLIAPFQTYMMDYQMYTPMSTMFNLYTMLKVDRNEYDENKMIESVKKAIANHPALLTRFSFNEDGLIQQQIDQSYVPELEIEKISKEEFEKIKEELVRPYRIINSRMYRCRAFDVDGELFLFFDVHHTVFDGTSFQVLLGDIMKAYYDMPLNRDYYYLMLRQNELLTETHRYAEAGEYFNRVYGGDDFVTLPYTDYETRENKLDSIRFEMNSDDAKLTELEKKYDIGRNAFFNLVTLLSVAIYDKKPNIKITWTYNGRDDLKKGDMVGLLLRDLPIMQRFRKKKQLRDVYADIKEQVNNAIAYSFYPYTMLNANVVTGDLVCFLYQKNIRDAGGSEIESVDILQNSAASENALDIQVLDDTNGLNLAIDYAASRYNRESIERFGKIFIAVFETLLELQDDDSSAVKDVIRGVNRKSGYFSWFILWMQS